MNTQIGPGPKIHTHTDTLKHTDLVTGCIRHAPMNTVHLASGHVSNVYRAMLTMTVFSSPPVISAILLILKNRTTKVNYTPSD